MFLKIVGIPYSYIYVEKKCSEAINAIKAPKFTQAAPHSSHIAEPSTVLGVAKLSKSSLALDFVHYKAKIAKIGSVFTLESLL